MKVHLQPVAGLDDLPHVVVAIDDDAFAAAAAGVDVALPPRQHGLTVERLHPEVGREDLARERLGTEPHEVPGGVEDHRAVLRRAELGRHEHIAVGDRGAVLRDRDRRGQQIRSRAEMLKAVRSGRRLRQRRGHDWRSRRRDLERERAAVASEHIQAGRDRHRLAPRERHRRDEAGAVAVAIRRRRPACGPLFDPVTLIDPIRSGETPRNVICVVGIEYRDPGVGNTDTCACAAGAATATARSRIAPVSRRGVSMNPPGAVICCRGWP